MNNSLLKKIEKAENLRKHKKSLLGLFSSVDYIGSAEIFEEIASECSGELKEQYLLEAANTFLMDGKEYAYYRASEIYKELSEINSDKFQEYSLKQILYLEKINKFTLSGQKYLELAEKFDNVDFYQSAVDSFSKVSNYKNNLLNAKNKLLLALLKKNPTKELIIRVKNLMESMNGINFQLYICILSIMLSETLELDNTLNKKESNLIHKIINSDENEIIAILEEYRNDNSLTVIGNRIFDIFIENLREGMNC